MKIIELKKKTLTWLSGNTAFPKTKKERKKREVHRRMYLPYPLNG